MKNKKTSLECWNHLSISLPEEEKKGERLTGVGPCPLDKGNETHRPKEFRACYRGVGNQTGQNSTRCFKKYTEGQKGGVGEVKGR